MSPRKRNVPQYAKTIYRRLPLPGAGRREPPPQKLFINHYPQSSGRPVYGWIPDPTPCAWVLGRLGRKGLRNGHRPRDEIPRGGATWTQFTAVEAIRDPPRLPRRVSTLHRKRVHDMRQDPIRHLEHERCRSGSLVTVNLRHRLHNVRDILLPRVRHLLGRLSSRASAWPGGFAD